MDPGLEQAICGQRHWNVKTQPRPRSLHLSPKTHQVHLSELLEYKGHPMPLPSVDVSKGPLADSVALVEVTGCLDHICLTPEKAVSRPAQRLFLLRNGGADILE